MAFDGNWSRFNDWLEVGGKGGSWPKPLSNHKLTAAQTSVVKRNVALLNNPDNFKTALNAFEEALALISDVKKREKKRKRYCIHFDENVFQNEVNLSGYKLSCSANFRGASFADKIVINRLSINGNLWITNATINGDIRLNFAKIKGSLRFNESEVKGSIRLNRSNVMGHIWLDDAVIDKNVSLDRATVKGDVSLNLTLIKGYISLYKALFSSHLSLNTVTTYGKISLNSSVVDGYVLIIGLNLSHNSNFSAENLLIKGAMIVNTYFNSNVNFQQLEVLESVQKVS